MTLARHACGLILCLLAGTTALGAQERAEPRNTATVSIGRSRDVADGVEEMVKAIGGDYLRKLSPKWEIGVQFDVDFHEGQGATAFLVTPVVAYSITDRWPVFAGAGVAFEEDHTLGFARVGSEYVFPFGHAGRWFVAPGGFVDIGESTTPSFMVALGVTF